MDAAGYKHVVLGLIFLKYIMDAFEERHAGVLADWGPEAAEVPDEVCLGILHGFDFGNRLALLPAAQEHTLAQGPQSPVTPVSRCVFFGS